MNTNQLVALVVVVALLIAGGWLLWGTETPSQTATTTPQNQATTTPQTATSSPIVVTTPVADAVVQSPLVVTGKARGTWYFEASFPIEVVDAYGKRLGSGIGEAQSDWMTEDFVPFKANITFTPPTTSTGFLVVHKDNPSGLPQFEDERRIPIRFATVTRDVVLYYYNANSDKDANGNILCSEKGLVPVVRQIPSSSTPLTDTIKLLLEGKLTATERSQGVTTEFPLAGVSLSSAVIVNGVATLTIADPQNKTSGGSCRVLVLRAQIEKTSKQFTTVGSVRILPDTLFQP